jgi:hypothetical protein
MSYVRFVIGLVLALAVASGTSRAFAQDGTTPPQKLPLTIFETQPVVPPDAVSRESLRDLPPPKPDRLSDAIRGTVVIDGPQCLPGEPGFIAPDPLRLPGRRRR